jgi:hypothetical protein
LLTVPLLTLSTTWLSSGDFLLARLASPATWFAFTNACVLEEPRTSRNIRSGHVWFAAGKSENALVESRRDRIHRPKGMFFLLVVSLFRSLLLALVPTFALEPPIYVNSKGEEIDPPLSKKPVDVAPTASSSKKKAVSRKSELYLLLLPLFMLTLWFSREQEVRQSRRE